MPAHAFFLAAKAANAVLGITILAAFVGAFLTIVVSGLYTVASVPATDTVVMRPSDWFNFTQGDLSLSDDDAGAITSLISYSNLTYPLWTYEHLVFNTLSLPQAQGNVSDASVELSVPAFRAKLNCSSLSAQSYTTTPVQDSLSNDSSLYEEGMIEISVNATVPIHCERMNTSQETIAWQQSFYVPNDTSPAYIGQAAMLQWREYDGKIDIDGQGGFETELSLNTGYLGCPTFAFTMGTASANHTLNETDSTSVWNASADLSIVLCYQNLEQVEADVVLELPDLSFNTSRPPSADEPTAKLLTYSNTSSELFEWPINIWLVELFNTAGNETILSPDGGSSTANDLDVFIQTLVQGRNGVAMDQLVGEANLDRLIASANDLYSTYMAQAISNSMRNTTSSGIPNKTYKATLTNPNWLRLEQNREPKVALQVMLAFLAVAAIATYLLADMRQVLPHNPCSIAGTATLLAGSELCTRDIIPEGAEWRSDDELMRAGVFDGMLFRMGWRDHGGDGATEKSFGIEVEKRGGVA